MMVNSFEGSYAKEVEGRARDRMMTIKNPVRYTLWYHSSPLRRVWVWMQLENGNAAVPSRTSTQDIGGGNVKERQG